MTNNNDKKEFFNALLRRDFKSFSIKVFNEVSPNSTFIDCWYVSVICDYIMDVLSGKNKRLIINIPPRYMKSIICSVALPAFILGHNPKATIIAVSYADELSLDLANKCRRVMEAPWYRELFPRTKLSKRATHDFETTKGGGRYATSVNGTLTGRGADYLIIDDPLKPQDAFSDTIREKTNDWYCNTLYSRLNNKKEGRILLVMQRLHEDDLTGYLLENDPSFSLLRMQAIAETDEEYILKSGEKIVRKKGEALHPERENIEQLLQIKATSGEYHFAGQYQQNPAPIEGGLIKKEWLHYYSQKELMAAIQSGKIKIRRIIHSWDTANKIENHNDYSACAKVLQDQDKKYYLLEIYRAKLEFPDLVRKVKKLHDEAKKEFGYSPDVLIEDHASGTSLIQELKENHSVYTKGVKPDANKRSRLMSVSHYIENGTCMFPDNSPDWWYDFEQELLRFPAVKHDDQCDALSQALLDKYNEPRARVLYA